MCRRSAAREKLRSLATAIAACSNRTSGRAITILRTQQWETASKRTAGNRQFRQEDFIPFAFRFANTAPIQMSSLFPTGITLALVFIGRLAILVRIMGSIQASVRWAE